MKNKIIIRNYLVFSSLGFLFACSSNSVVFNKSFKPGKVVSSNLNPELEFDRSEKKSITSGTNSELQVKDDELVGGLDREGTKNALVGPSEKKSKVGLVIKDLLRFSVPKSSLEAKGMEENSALKFQDEKKTPGISIAGFVLGICSLLFAPIITGALGIIFSAIGLGKDSTQYKKGLAIAGLICGVLGLIFGLIILAAL